MSEKLVTWRKCRRILVKVVKVECNLVLQDEDDWIKVENSLGQTLKHLNKASCKHQVNNNMRILFSFQKSPFKMTGLRLVRINLSFLYVSFLHQIKNLLSSWSDDWAVFCVGPAPSYTTAQWWNNDQGTLHSQSLQLTLGNLSWNNSRSPTGADAQPTYLKSKCTKESKLYKFHF